MKNRKISIGKIYKWLNLSFKNSIIIIMGVLLGVLSLCSLFFTTYISQNTNEHVTYKIGNPLILIVLLIIILALLFMYDRKYRIDKINTKKIFFALICYTIITGIGVIFLVRGVPVGDQALVSNIADQFNAHNFSSLLRGGYLFVYPYQLGLISLLQLLYRFFGKSQYVVLQVINVGAVLVSQYFLYKITDISFKNKKVNNTLLLLLFGCLPLIMYVVFVYGTLVSLCLGLAAIWAELKYFEDGRYRYFLVAVLAICLAVLIKSNSLIILVAMVIMLFMNIVKEKKPAKFLLVILLILAVVLSGDILNAIYENRSGIIISKGAPSVAWVAMGLKDGPRAPGWYNAYALPKKKDDYSTKEVTELAQASIKKSVAGFVENPSYAISFFGQKFASQWNDPSYQSIWVGSVMLRSGELSKIGNSLYNNDNGRVYNSLLSFMKLYQSLIFISAFGFILLSWRKIKYHQLFLVLVVIGGFLFHMAWEAKGEYIMPYFVMLIPLAAVGVVYALDYINKKTEENTKY